MKSDTPRCEAARFEALRSSALRTDCIPLKLGEELERELNETRVTLDQMTEKALYWIERAYGTRKTDTHQQTKPSDTSINK